MWDIDTNTNAHLKVNKCNCKEWKGSSVHSNRGVCGIWTGMRFHAAWGAAWQEKLCSLTNLHWRANNCKRSVTEAPHIQSKAVSSERAWYQKYIALPFQSFTCVTDPKPADSRKHRNPLAEWARLADSSTNKCTFHGRLVHTRGHLEPGTMWCHLRLPLAWGQLQQQPRIRWYLGQRTFA